MDVVSCLTSEGVRAVSICGIFLRGFGSSCPLAIRLSNFIVLVNSGEESTACFS